MNAKTFAAGIAAAALAIAAAMPAMADGAKPTYVGMTEQDVGVMDRARTAYDPKGVPLGGFRLFPSLDLSATYDDNVFRTLSPQSDWYFTVSPALRLKSQWGRHFFEIYSGLNYFNYVTYTDENLTDWRVGADGRYDISRAANLRANVFYGHMHELWSAPNNVVGFQASPNRYYQLHADVAAVYQPNRLGFGLGAVADKYNWTDTPRIGGGILDNDDRDQSEYQAYLKVYYDFSPGYAAFFKASYDERDFVEFFDRGGLHRSSHGYRLDGGLNFKITHLVSGEVFAGYLQQSFADNVPIPLQDVSGFDFGAEVDWYVSPIFTMHLSGSRRLDDVVLGGVSVADNKTVALSADYEFRPNIILQARGGYTDSRYVGSSRTDQYPSAGVGIKYLMNRNVSLDVEYTYSRRSTSSASAAYSDNVVSIGLRLHL